MAIFELRQFVNSDDIERERATKIFVRQPLHAFRIYQPYVRVIIQPFVFLVAVQQAELQAAELLPLRCLLSPSLTTYAEWGDYEHGLSAAGSAQVAERLESYASFSAAGAQWQAAGNYVPYDATFSTAIGGYPMGAVLTSTTLGVFWQSTAENNTTDPDGGSPANWARVIPIKASAAEVIAGTNDTDFITPKSLHDSGVLGGGQSALTITSNSQGFAMGIPIGGDTYYLQWSLITAAGNSDFTWVYPVALTTQSWAWCSGGGTNTDDSDCRIRSTTTFSATGANSDGPSHSVWVYSIGY